MSGGSSEAHDPAWLHLGFRPTRRRDRNEAAPRARRFDLSLEREPEMPRPEELARLRPQPDRTTPRRDLLRPWTNGEIGAARRGQIRTPVDREHASTQPD